LSDEQQTLTFITDDQIALELRQIANGLHHLEAVIPSLKRSVDRLISQLAPGDTDSDED
jgi:hypothetical protein